jgi:cation:H+ antiporter
MLITSLLAGLVLFDGQLTWLDGLFLLLLAVLWLVYIVKIARLAELQGSDTLTREQVAELPRGGSLSVAFLWLGVALIIMPMSTRMVVDNATVVANHFAMSELTIGLTVIAIVTGCRNWRPPLPGHVKEKTILRSVISSARIFSTSRWCWVYPR